MDKSISEDNLNQTSSSEVCCEVDHSQHESFVEETESWDRWGIILSSLCALHCLLTPLLALSLPAFGAYFENELFHVGLAAFVLPVGIYAFVSGYKHHKKLGLLILGMVGLFLVAAASFLPHSLEVLISETVLMIIGSSALIVGHILNRRACHCESH